MPNAMQNADKNRKRYAGEFGFKRLDTNGAATPADRFWKLLCVGASTSQVIISATSARGDDLANVTFAGGTVIEGDFTEVECGDGDSGLLAYYYDDPS